MKKLLRKVVWVLVIGFVIANVVAFMHAWKFTHFVDTDAPRTADPKALPLSSRLKILVMGIDNPRPKHKSLPKYRYETVTIEGEQALSAWKLKAETHKGTVILFHGYSGEKSSLLERSYVFLKNGYDIWLVDFSGSGDSEGNVTSVGFSESAEVKAWYDHVKEEGETNVYLLGTSMGAAAILKAVRDDNLEPAGIMLECPFGSLYQTVRARFSMMGVPKFPGYIGGALLSFWGGMQHGYWAFSHNPSEYAKSVTSPVLLLYGEQDDRVSREETDAIYTNLQRKKMLVVYPEAGHEVFVQNEKRWTKDVGDFMKQIEATPIPK